MSSRSAERLSACASDPLLSPYPPGDDAGSVTDRQDRERFHHLPEPVLPQDTVETVDVRAVHPSSDEHEDRARMLREAGGGI